MREKDKKNRYGRQIARLVGLLIGGAAGYGLAVLTLHLIPEFAGDLTAGAKNAVFLCSALLFALLFALSAPSFCSWIVNLGYYLERKLAKYALRDIAGGVIGLFLGLFAAFLLGNLLSFIPIYGLAVGLTVLLYFGLAFLGASLGIKHFSGLVVVKEKSEPKADTNLKVLDSSAIIDGRILDLVKFGFIEGTLVVPNCILTELRLISDSKDDLKRTRGRHGLDILAELQNMETAKVVVTDDDFPDALDTDAKLLKTAEKMNAKVLTTDYNLNKVAVVMGLQVLNVNDLASALKARVLPGEMMQIAVVKRGKDPRQGVGYLDDGTMVVVENGGADIGRTVQVVVTNQMQTAAGRMVFTRKSDISPENSEKTV